MIPQLNGLRVLLVEDQMIVAMQMEDVLHAAGCEIIGPAGTLRMALVLAREELLDAAILDINLDDERTFPVAEVLLARGIPFIFATGYGEDALPARWRSSPRLTKPFQSKHLEQLIGSVSSRPRDLRADLDEGDVGGADES